MSFKVEHGDITKYKGDAIINSLGTDTTVYGKLCDAIVKANADSALPRFLESINGKIKILDCFITESPHLSVTHIIHIVAPYKKSDYNYLKYIVAYIKLLNLARDNKLYKLAVPLIGTGPNGYSHRACKSIVEAMCEAYASYFPEMEITIYYHGTKSVSTKKAQIVYFDIDELKDLIMKYKTNTVFTGSVYTMNFTKELFLNPHYGIISFVSFLYFLVYELLSPFIEIFGIITIIISAFIEMLNIQFMITFMLIYIVFNSMLSFSIFFSRLHVENIKLTILDFLKALALSIFEITILRVVILSARFSAFIGYRKHKYVWERVDRRKIKYQ